jgi:hypothetical protein
VALDDEAPTGPGRGASGRGEGVAGAGAAEPSRSVEDGDAVDDEDPTVLPGPGARRAVTASPGAGATGAAEELEEEATVLGGRARVLPRPEPRTEPAPRSRAGLVAVLVVGLLVLVAGGVVAGAVLLGDDEPAAENGDEGPSPTVAEGTPDEQVAAVPELTGVTVEDEDATGVTYRLSWSTEGTDQAVIVTSRPAESDWPGTVLTLGGVLPTTSAGGWTTPEPLEPGARCFALGALTPEREVVFDYDGATCVDADGVPTAG